MISNIFKILIPALNIIETKQSRKYVDEALKLKREWYEEYNKERSDDAKLDNIRIELELLIDSVGPYLEAQNTKDK